MTKLRPPSAAAVMGGAAALWGLAIGLRPLGDNSALTHLATGRLILDHGVPDRDPFSFTAAHLPWTVSSWLASVGMALAERLDEDHGVLLARALVTTALAVLAWRLTRPAGTLAGRIIAVSVVLVLGSGAWPERPLLLGLLFLAVLVTMAEGGRGSPWLVAPVMWLWVNVHGSFPLGLVYLGVRLAGRRLDRSPPGRLPSLALAAVVGTVAGAVNPVGPRLLVFPLRLLGRHDVLARVVEWRSPDFSQPANLVFLVALLVALALAGRRRSWEDGLVTGVFGVAACLGQRNMTLATVAMAPVLARGLAGIGTVDGAQRNRVTATAGLALAMVAGLLVTTALQRDAYDLERYPVDQLDWMEAEGLMDGRVATQDFVGNLVLAREGPGEHVFFDDRYDLYPKAFMKDAVALLDGNEGWQRRLDRYRIDTVLWQRSKPLSGLLALDPGWRVVRKDKDWIVAVRVEAG
ncbi:MAG: hypothetical protein ACR2MO_15215 [Acidimicrobiales bacterium]